MKRLLTISLAAAIMLASAAGCSSKMVKRSEKGDSTKIDTPAVEYGPEIYKPVPGRYGGRIVLAEFSEPKSFNPIVSSETTTSLYTGLMFLGLTTTNRWTFEVEPELATEWTVDETGLIWMVKLRKDVTWSDGHPFTADDVLFTYETTYDKRWMSPMRDLLTGPNGEQWQIEKIDDYTIKFILYEKNAIFPQLIGDGVIPKHKFKPMVDGGKFNEALSANTDPNDIVVTGPFLLDRYETGSKVVMKRNPRYYKKDSAGNRMPYLDEIIFLIVPSLDVQILKFRQKETDYTSLRGSDYPIFKPLQKKDDFTIYELGPAMGNSFVFFNQNTGANPQTGKPFVEPHKLKWFRDARFRRAVSYAIDRPFIVESILNGLGYPLYGPINPQSGLYFANPNVPRFEYDLDKAKALLKEMGMEDRNGDGIIEDIDGHDVEFNLTTNSGNDVRERIAETIRKDLIKLGMKVNYRPMNFNILISKLDSTYDWEACVMSLTGSPEPHWGANVWKSSGHTHMWFPKQKTPSTEWEAEIDKLFAEGVRELNREKRREIYFRWQKIVGEQQPFIYTASPERLYALRNKFGNIFPAPYGGFQGRGGPFRDIEEVFVLEDAD